jgi:protein involved in polysaccharide export with SLBB domain
VGAPGFYLLSSDELLTDALMRAGGPTGDAKVTSIRIERGDRKIWEGDPLQQAIAEGRTLDQLNLQAGDRIVVPQSGGNAWDLVRNIGLLTGIGLSVVFILRAF